MTGSSEIQAKLFYEKYESIDEAVVYFFDNGPLQEPTFNLKIDVYNNGLYVLGNFYAFPSDNFPIQG